MMKYKGYTGVLEIDEESGLIYGHVIGLRDGINFQGESVAEVRRSFEESVDCYLKLCASRNEPPERPFSGRFLIRISSDLHRAMVKDALTRHMSLNALVEATLSEAFPIPEAPRRIERRAAKAKPVLAREKKGTAAKPKAKAAKPKSIAAKASAKPTAPPSR
jgi:predicted HicB family RNase H-like nuclease